MPEEEDGGKRGGGMGKRSTWEASLVHEAEGFGATQEAGSMKGLKRRKKTEQVLPGSATTTRWRSAVCPISYHGDELARQLIL